MTGRDFTQVLAGGPERKVPFEPLEDGVEDEVSVRVDLEAAGGMRLVLRRLAEAGLLRESPTVTGRSLLEETRDAAEAIGILIKVGKVRLKSVSQEATVLKKGTTGTPRTFFGWCSTSRRRATSRGCAR